MKEKYIIALGSSAGGLTALYKFFDNVIPDGVSYVITTHLYAHERSLLVELIQKHSAIKVIEVSDEIIVSTNCVYVMPENKVMTIKKGRLILTERDLSVKINMAIDIFFKSLAKDEHFKKIAVILSGMGSDGTEGVKAISENGGFVIAQIPISAKSASMPKSVIASGYANMILYPEKMPEAIIKYVSQQIVLNSLK